MATDLMGRGGDLMPHRTTGSALTDAAFQALYIASLSDGRDGDADLDGVNTVPWASLSGSTYTVTRVGCPINLRVRAGITLVTRGYHGPYCRGDLYNYGTIHCNGADASAGTAGAAFAAGSFAANIAGSAGGINAANGAAAAGTTAANPVGGRYEGGPGGNSVGAANTGAAGGAVTAANVTRGTMDAMAWAQIASWITQPGQLTDNGPGTGGGGGAGVLGGVGGGGGASAGVMHFSARNVYNYGTISANGGNGGNGTTAGCGGGGGGSGGKVLYYAGSWTGSLPIAYSGKGGLSGSTTGVVGSPGLSGIVQRLNPVDARTYRYTLSASEYGAALVAGDLDFTGRFTAGTIPGKNTGVPGTATGGGGFWVCEFTSGAGTTGLRYDAVNNQLLLVVEGVTKVTAVTTDTAPTFLPWTLGDDVEYRIWSNAGGAGIRWGVNGCFGNDETAAGVGSITAFTAGEALGTASTWNSAQYASASKANSVIGRVVVLGDSVLAARSNSVAEDGSPVGTLLGITGPIRSLATAGGTAATQLTAWQACNCRGSATVVAVVIHVGLNDITVDAQTSAQTATRQQALLADIYAQNPTAKVFYCAPSPVRRTNTEANRVVILEMDANVKGTGANNLTGLTARVTTHQALMGDDNDCLRHRADANDFSHPNRTGRQFFATAIAAVLASNGVT